MHDLNDLISLASKWTLGTATGVNDLGQIVGVGMISGVSHAFLLTPVPVPEPGTALLLCLGAWVLCRRRKS